MLATCVRKFAAQNLKIRPIWSHCSQSNASTVVIAYLKLVAFVRIVRHVQCDQIGRFFNVLSDMV